MRDPYLYEDVLGGQSVEYSDPFDIVDDIHHVLKDMREKGLAIFENKDMRNIGILSIFREHCPIKISSVLYLAQEGFFYGQRIQSKTKAELSMQDKLKQQFPDWLIVSPDAYKTVNSSMLEGREKVYFFTDYINHISYKKFVAIVREKNIPFGYIGSRNIESVIRQIYQEMCK